jgi:MAPEG family
MMGFLELNQVSATLLHGMGLTLVAARLLHGYALSFAQKFVFGRFFGTLLTLGLLLVGGGLCVFQGLRAAGLA